MDNITTSQIHNGLPIYPHDHLSHGQAALWQRRAHYARAPTTDNCHKHLLAASTAPYQVSFTIDECVTEPSMIFSQTYHASHSRLSVLPLSDGLVLWSYVALIISVHMYYVLGVIADICQYLDVYCLIIHPRHRVKKAG